MAISLNTGIEGVSYQAQITELRTGFPQRKENLPINASIPSHVKEVFNLHSYTRMLEGVVAPTIPNRYITAPAAYSRLFQEIAAVAGNYTSGDDHEQQVVQAAQVLLNAMQSDFEAFSTGRNALIEG